MPVFALWSAPRSRSTAFFRSMLERGDLVAVHEPFYDLAVFGDTDVGGRAFESATALLAWLREGTDGVRVFVKDTTDRRHPSVLADRRFLAGARHTFLIRSPEEIVASYSALRPEMGIDEIGVEALHELHSAVSDTGNRPIVVDSADLVARPAATMEAFCEAVGLPFISRALAWEPGEQPAWRRSARWHTDVASSSGFERSDHAYTETVESSDRLACYAAHHRPFYDLLHAQRLAIDTVERTGVAP